MPGLFCPVGGSPSDEAFKRLVRDRDDSQSPDASFHDGHCDVKTVVLVGNVDEPGTPYRFCSWKGRNRQDPVVTPIWKVAMASVRDPGDPRITIDVPGTKKDLVCMTSGLTDHNPTIEILDGLWEEFGNDAVRHVINLGDGVRHRRIELDQGLLSYLPLSHHLNTTKFRAAGSLSSERDAKI